MSNEYFILYDNKIKSIYPYKYVSVAFASNARCVFLYNTVNKVKGF